MGNFLIKTNAYQAFRKSIYEIRLAKLNSKYLSYKLQNFVLKMAQFFEKKAIRKLPIIR